MSDSEQKTGSTDKPLGDTGSGASGGGSIGNAPGPGSATGGDPKQGVRAPNAGEIEPANRRLDQHPHQTAEVPYGSGNEPEIAGKGGLDAQNAENTDQAKPVNPHTEPIRGN